MNLKYLNNLQLNPYPNTQLDLFYSDSSPFRCMTPSTWLTNCADPSMRLQSPTKKVVGCKVLQFIQTMKIKKMLGHKTLWCTCASTSSRERDELGQELHLQSQFAWIEFTQSLCNLWTLWCPLNWSFYMSRVRRKESLKTHSRIPRKSDWNSDNLKSRQIASVEHTECRIASLSSIDAAVDQLSSFNDFVLWTCFLEQTWKLQY